MANILKIKRGLEADRTGITPAEGEFLYTTDEKKLYIGDGSTAGGIPVGSGSISNNLFAIEGSVDLTTSGNQGMGTLPANADVMRTTLVVITQSNAATTVLIGDTTNGVSSYMASTENDPEIAATYIANNFVSNGGTARTINAFIATPGTVGDGVGIIEYRLSTG